MDSRERVLRTLNHEEPDRVPFDLGGTGLTTIHITAYKNLRRYLGLRETEPHVAFVAEQLVLLDEDVAQRLQTDVRPVLPGIPTEFEYVFRDQGRYEAYTDEWGIGWRKPKDGGFYYDMYHHPLAEADSLEELRAYPFPDPVDEGRFATLRDQAESAAAEEKAIALSGPCAGIAEVYSWLRGYKQYFLDLGMRPDFVTLMLDRLVAFKCAYWERALGEVGSLVDVVVEADDLAGQESLLLSPDTYRALIKPHHQLLFNFIKDQASVKVFFHSCGAARPLVGDFIDAGIDILNPVQISAEGMDPRALKEAFGEDVVFWGGGVDTQRVLCDGTPQDVRRDVHRNIEALAPGGGFVFATVHDIQADVPPENIVAMWDAWKTHGLYG